MHVRLSSAVTLCFARNVLLFTMPSLDCGKCIYKIIILGDNFLVPCWSNDLNVKTRECIIFIIILIALNFNPATL